jgi:hypothetical protein
MRRLLVIIPFLLVGCVPAVWVQEKGVQSFEPLNFSVQMPAGWMRLNKGDFLLVTRDGILLQTIAIDKTAIGKPLKYTRKMLGKGMLPQEAADVVIDNMLSNQNIGAFDLKENIPVTLSGQPGFKITYRHKSKDGVWLKCVEYGLLHGEWFYSIRYQAAERHYFEKDVKTFEEFVKSFKLINM